MTVSQIDGELGIGANVLGRWWLELRQVPTQVFVDNGRPRDKELSQLRHELARVTKEREFCAKRSSRKRGHEVSDDPMMPRRVSHSMDVSVFAGVGQRLLWLDHASAESTAQEDIRLPSHIRRLHTESDGISGSCGFGRIYATPGSGVGGTGWPV